MNQININPQGEKVMSKKNPGKKLDRLASELGTTIKGMTPEQKRQYVREDTMKTKISA